MRVTLALCVNPPVDGLPLPETPVKVSVYVPSGVLRLVVTVAVAVSGHGPLSEGEPGEIENVESAGAPVQASPTFPVKPPSGVKVTLYVVVRPGETVSAGGPAEIPKSITFCVTGGERLA